MFAFEPYVLFAVAEETVVVLITGWLAFGPPVNRHEIERK